MELELNSKPRSLIRCRLEKSWEWDDMEVDSRSDEAGRELQQRGVYKETVDMDEQMWGNLPGHLLESHILVRLPLESLFRFRSVYEWIQVFREEEMAKLADAKEAKEGHIRFLAFHCLHSMLFISPLAKFVRPILAPLVLKLQRIVGKHDSFQSLPLGVGKSGSSHIL